MTDAERLQMEGRPLLLFDGVCALCHGFVQWMMKRDRRAVLRFVPLESGLGQEILARFPESGAGEGVVLVTDALTASERIYRRSDAAGAALMVLGGRWRGAGWFVGVVPRPLRELGYGLVARVRYRLFGRYAQCPLPTPEQRNRILGVGQ